MVMFRESDAIAPGQIANAPPKPQGGSEGGSQTLAVQKDSGGPYVNVSIASDATRKYTGLTVDSITDAAPDKDSSPSGVTSVSGPAPDVADGTLTYKVHGSGSASVVNLTYTIHYEPSDEVLRVWNEQVLAAQHAWQAQLQEEAFDRAKRLIVAKSRVRPRPAADLRDEERYEIMNRMISEAFHDGSAQALPSPVEIELFHRYFDVSAIFYYVHPAWWMPRYGAARDDYEITDDSEPARFGKSLGWVIQLDGDRRRSEFLNSPWLRVCTPIRPGVEREAIAWLAQHVEGGVGYSTEPTAPVGQLLAGIEAQRAVENAAPAGPDYVTLDGQVPPSRESSAIAYPVVDEFDVVVPTEGFVYDKLTTE